MRNTDNNSHFKPSGKYRKGSYKVRKWMMYEVLEDDDDEIDDYETEAQVLPLKNARKRKRGAFRTEGKKREINPKECREVLEASAPRSPELDTVRIYFDCDWMVDLDSFIPQTANKKVFTCIRDSLGDVAYTNERYKNEMRMSWYGKMQVSEELKKWGKNGKYVKRVLCFEYSLAKWYGMTSGINLGIEPSAKRILVPCVQAMQALGLDRYLKGHYTFKQLVSYFVERAEIRRFDLSLNFQVPPGYTPSEYIDVLERCHLNRQGATREGDGSISFGTAKSPYRTIWYDKEKEQKNFYTKRDSDPHMKYVDEYGEVHDLDYNMVKKEFYDKNFDLFQNKLRFEVQFRTKFMQENNLEVQGMDNIDNVIRLGVLYWRDVLDQFDEQLNAANFQYKDDDKTAIARVLDDLDSMKDSGVISRTVCANQREFVIDCYRKGWKAVAREIGTSLFSKKRKWCKTELNYDVKILPDQLPIMRIMPTIYLSRTGKMLSQFVLNPAPVQQARAV